MYKDKLTGEQLAALRRTMGRRIAVLSNEVLWDGSDKSMEYEFRRFYLCKLFGYPNWLKFKLAHIESPSIDRRLELLAGPYALTIFRVMELKHGPV